MNYGDSISQEEKELIANTVSFPVQQIAESMFRLGYRYIARDTRGIYCTENEPNYSGSYRTNSDFIDIIIFGIGKMPDESKFLCPDDMKEIKKLFIPDKKGIPLLWLDTCKEYEW